MVKFPVLVLRPYVARIGIISQNTSDRNIKDFFSPLNVVHITRMSDGNVDVEFGSLQELAEAKKKNNDTLAGRPVNIVLSGRDRSGHQRRDSGPSGPPIRPSGDHGSDAEPAFGGGHQFTEETAGRPVEEDLADQDRSDNLMKYYERHPRDQQTWDSGSSGARQSYPVPGEGEVHGTALGDEYSTNLIGAIDQGTSSTNFLIISSTTAQIIASHKIEFKHHSPREGWLEFDADEILSTTKGCIEKGCEKLTELKFDFKKIKAVGITNQRETTIVWDRTTGKALHRAIVWCDVRTKALAEKYVKLFGNKFHKLSGLFIHPYFTALKLRWLLDNVPDVQIAAKNGRLMAGTVDAWLIWNLTGGPQGGQFVTDVSNASRTLLMNIKTLKWDRRLLKAFDISETLLPTIKNSSEIYGHIVDGHLTGVPISGCLGDQQAALVGEACFKERMCKNTYDNGCCMLANVGQRPKLSKFGLQTTVAYKFGPDAPTVYALEGSTLEGSVTGNCVRWLRDNLQIVNTSKDVEELAGSVKNTSGVYFVPAFSGLYSPHWDSQARAHIIGITENTTKAHIARAALEAVCFKAKEMLEAMRNDGGVSMDSVRLLADGEMAKNDLFMQIQADFLGVPVVRPQLAEPSGLGAAIAAGMAKGVDLWTIEFIENHPPALDEFVPKMSAIERDKTFAGWKKAVKHAMNWIGV